MPSTADKSSIETQIAKLQRAINERHEQTKADQTAIRKLVAELHKLSIVDALNVADGVRVRYRHSSRGALNDALGTVTAIRRTRASVDFGKHGKWEFLIEDLLATQSGKEQGEFISFGGFN